MSDTATTTDTPPREAAPEPDGSSRGESLAFFAVGLAAMALIAAVIAVGIAMRAVERAESAPAGGGGAAAVVSVELTDFEITPGDIEIAAGGSLSITNAGATEHNLYVGDLHTTNLQTGGTETLDLSSLAPGEYEMHCNVAGHTDLGMVGTLTVR